MAKTDGMGGYDLERMIEVAPPFGCRLLISLPPAPPPPPQDRGDRDGPWQKNLDEAGVGGISPQQGGGRAPQVSEMLLWCSVVQTSLRCIRILSTAGSCRPRIQLNQHVLAWIGPP